MNLSRLHIVAIIGSHDAASKRFDSEVLGFTKPSRGRRRESRSAAKPAIQKHFGKDVIAECETEAREELRKKYGG